MNRPASRQAAAKLMPGARLAEALIKAQIALRAPVKNRTVSIRSGRENYDFAYATLDTIVEHVLRPVLPEHGLWFSQHTRFEDAGQTVITDILHSSGEVKLCPIAMPPLPDSPHEAGSLISYFKRYGLCAAFGLVAEDDDDGRLSAAVSDELVSPDQVKELEGLAGGSAHELDRLCRYLRVPSLQALPAAKLERARAALKVRSAA